MNTQPSPCEEMLTLEQPLSDSGPERKLIIGLPSGMAAGERRFPLTPEGTEQLADRNILVKIESGAGKPIHYSDNDYSRAGASVCERQKSLRADIIISPAPLYKAETLYMRRGTVLLTLLRSVIDRPDYARALQKAGVNVIAADLIDNNGHRPVADILHEIDGCASVVVASSLLADPVNGKGILLGGVTGVGPGEVLILGSGMGAIAAAHNALGLGATVRMFDNDIYSLRSASRVLNYQTIAAAPHPRVLKSALQTADIVIATPMSGMPVIDGELAAAMKRRVITFDLTNKPGATFPSLPLIDLGNTEIDSFKASNSRVCCHNVGGRVPRTAAMALSNSIVAGCDSLRASTGSLAEMPAPMRQALLFYWGKCVNSAAAEALGTRALDINLLIGN